MALCLFPSLIFFKLDQDSEKIKEKYIYPDSNFISINGTNIHFRKTGSGATTILLLHGVLSSLHTWEYWQKELSKDYTVVTIDLPGFALTAPMKNNNYSLSSYLTTINNLRLALGIEKMIIGGNSLGSFIANCYTLKYPNVVKKLIMLDPPGINAPLPFWMQLYKTPLIKETAKFISPNFIVAHAVKDTYKKKSKVTPALIDKNFDMLTSNQVRQNFGKILALDKDPETPTHNDLKK